MRTTHNCSNYVLAVNNNLLGCESVMIIIWETKRTAEWNLKKKNKVAFVLTIFTNMIPN